MVEGFNKYYLSDFVHRNIGFGWIAAKLIQYLDHATHAKRLGYTVGLLICRSHGVYNTSPTINAMRKAMFSSSSCQGSQELS